MKLRDISSTDLLVVMAVVFVLMALLLPAVQANRDAAKQTFWPKLQPTEEDWKRLGP